MTPTVQVVHPKKCERRGQDIRRHLAFERSAAMRNFAATDAQRARR